MRVILPDFVVMLISFSTSSISRPVLLQTVVKVVLPGKLLEAGLAFTTVVHFQQTPLFSLVQNGNASRDMSSKGNVFFISV